jgi:hypothetical protein
VDLLEGAFIPALTMRGHPSQREHTHPTGVLLYKSLTVGMIGVGAHTVYVCACVRTSVYMCVCTLRCTLLSNLDVQNLQKLKRVRSLLLYDSAENTTCRLKAFSSQMSLGPQ